MKWCIGLLLFFSVPAAVQAQLPVMNVIRHQWAGGICCSGGTDYTCTISFPAEQFRCFDSLQLLVDGIRVTIPDYLLTKTLRGDSLVLFSYTFGCRFNRCGDNAYETSWYGLTARDDHEQQEVLPDAFVVIRPNSKETGTDIRITDTMTAYP
jgi:hypothetical protein